MECMNERSIFLAALDIDDASAREAYVARACGADVVLRREVEKLLEAHQEPAGFMQRPAPALVAGIDERPIAEKPGTVIGPYKLLEQIGEGGFGVVFMAQQLRPVVRRVALKVLKPGMDTRQIIARFEAERQALAMMDHPHIAHVLDGGETASGRPYFVMELVRGVPITQYCDDNQLPIRDRLRLFVDLCQAVQHAHQKGIIHRDLKPSNVLITLHDDKAIVKVIDFGIAKATGQQLTDKTLLTSFAQLMGTPLYMSPEQAQPSGLDVDTRSDIYSLGVVLYELLTGTTPFDKQRLKTAAYEEIRRIIGQEEPLKPSTRTSTPGRAPSRVSANRRCDLPELSRQLRGELDWIVMKCLEKDRNRRYATANGLAADVERYLRDEPVQACPPSAWYRFRKLARRNRVPFIAASAVVVLMLLSIVMLVISNVRVRREQARTQVEKQRAEAAQQLALQRADEINQGLQRLKSANALVDAGRFYIEERRWDDSSAAFTAAIDLRHEHAPAWEGRGMLYASLGLWDLAASDLAQAAELQEPSTSQRWLVLALTRAYDGDLPGYRDVCARMDELFQGTTVIHFKMDLVRAGALLPDSSADPASQVKMAEPIVATNPNVPLFLHTLGAAYYRAGQYEQAIQCLRRSLEIEPNWSARDMNYPFLALAHYRLGRHDDARQALTNAERAIDQWTQARCETSGREYWVVSQGATNFWPVPWWDWMACQLACAEARRVMGLSPLPDDPRLRVLRARVFAGLRWPDKALEEYEIALQERPDDKQLLLEAHRSRGYLHVSHRRWQEAAAEYARASELQPDEPYFWWYQAVLHLAASDREAYRRVCAALQERFGGSEDPRTAHTVVAACTLLPDTLPDMGQLVPVAQVAAGWYPGASRVLGAAQCRAGAHQEAVHSFREAASHYRLRPADLLLLAIAYHHLGEAHQAQRCLSDALQWIQQADRRELNDPASTQPGWGDWHEPLYVPLLRREVEELLKP
jgi:serine/threonine protein kinase/Flp pilus assembly protein TadD